MEKILIGILVIFVGFSALTCDEPGRNPPEETDIKTFIRTFGGNKEEYGFDVQVTPDSGYILTGFSTTYGNGSWDVWLVKTTQDGNGVWDQTFGNDLRDVGYSIQVTADGGFIILGDTQVRENDADILLLKTDENGIMEWQKTFGGADNEGGRCVKRTADGGFILTGYTYSMGQGGRDLLLIKTDNNGNEEWTKTLGWVYNDMGYSIVQTDDLGYLIVGYQYNPYEKKRDLWIIKTDSNGELQWSKSLGENSDDAGFSIVRTKDAGFIIAGSTNSRGNDWYDLWLLKIDFSGNVIWENVYTTSNRKDDQWKVQPTLDRGFICIGTTTLFSRGVDALMIKMDSTGVVEWEQSYGGIGTELGLAVAQPGDGGFAFLGRTNTYGNGLYDFFFVKTDSIGNTVNYPEY